MYGLSSRDSLSKIQTRWVTAVEETTKVIHVPPSKTSSEVMYLQNKIIELEKICQALEERIVALEARCEMRENNKVTHSPEVKDTTVPTPSEISSLIREDQEDPEDREDQESECPSMLQEEELSIDP